MRKQILVIKQPMAKKVFGFTWAFEAFQDHDTFYTKRMFGGMAAYVHGRMVMLLAEDPDEHSYRGKQYDFAIWYGILLPTDREHHESLQKEFPQLVPHPVLGKWLFLSAKDQNFESLSMEISERIENDDDRFGIYPQVKKKTNK